MTSLASWPESWSSPLWPVAIVAGTAIVLIVILLAGPRLVRDTRAVTMALWCPVRDREADVTFQVTVWDGRCVDVERCSLLAPPTAVNCDKACLAGQACDPTRPYAAVT